MRVPLVSTQSILLALLFATGVQGAEHLLKADECAAFYPTLGWHDATIGLWHVPV